MSDEFDWLTRRKLARLERQATRAARWQERRPIVKAILVRLIQWLSFIAILYALANLGVIFYRGFRSENTLPLVGGVLGLVWLSSQHPRVRRHLHLPWGLNISWRRYLSQLMNLPRLLNLPQRLSFPRLLSFLRLLGLLWGRVLSWRLNLPWRWVLSWLLNLPKRFSLFQRLRIPWRLASPLKYLQPTAIAVSKLYGRIPWKVRRWAPAGFAAIAAVVVLATIPFADIGARIFAPEKVAGRARIVDGDTLVIRGRLIRLYGIDAPEPMQTCRTARGNRWGCGERAIRRLRRLTRRRSIECLIKTNDDQGRASAVCLAGKTNINREMVRHGLAWAFRDQSSSFSTAEEGAKKARRGLWRGKAQAPWEYRSKSWQVAKARAPDGCPIKGDISRHGKIYHVPWGNRYRRVKVNLRNGERWFCSEREALAAGWRAPRP